MLYMVTFTINIPQMLAYIYTSTMDPMGLVIIHPPNPGIPNLARRGRATV